MSVRIKIKNRYNEQKIAYLRFQGTMNYITYGGVITHDGSGDGHKLKFDAGQTLEFQVDENQDIISGTFWTDTADKRQWNTNRPSTDQAGPQCSQVEFTIDSLKGKPNVVSYDISAVEGICDSYHMYFHPYGILYPRYNDVLNCQPSMIPSFKKWNGFVPSDKNNPEYSAQKQSQIGCPADDCMGKKICHEYVDKNSYGKSDGYCQWLYDNKCKGYCWAYDEMKCPSGKTCVYDKNGNPMYKLDGVKGDTCKDCECLPQIDNPRDAINTMNYKGADKSVEGVPTNPQPHRRDGTLLIHFGPLGTQLEPEPWPGPPEPEPEPPEPGPPEPEPEPPEPEPEPEPFTPSEKKAINTVLLIVIILSIIAILFKIFKK
jgi:hypothetical protein